MGVERWHVAYDEAGIAEDDRPPEALIDEVSHAGVIASSDLPRAVMSAAHLARGREVTISPLLREVPLPIPGSFPFRVPLAAWAALIHLRWGFDLARRRGAPIEAIERARLAARWCGETCARDVDGGVLAVVTHGAFRRLLAQELLVHHWRAKPGRRSYAHWSVWRLEN